MAKHGSTGLPCNDQWEFEILSGRDMGTDKNPFNQLCNQVIAIKSLSLGRYHCVTGSSIQRSIRMSVCWWFGGRINERMALLQASQAGFMALWETKQRHGVYGSSIFSPQTGLYTT